jgi:hypothetical protein
MDLRIFLKNISIFRQIRNRHKKIESNTGLHSSVLFSIPYIMNAEYVGFGNLQAEKYGSEENRILRQRQNRENITKVLNKV